MQLKPLQTEAKPISRETPSAILAKRRLFQLLYRGFPCRLTPSIRVSAHRVGGCYRGCPIEFHAPNCAIANTHQVTLTYRGRSYTTYL